MTELERSAVELIRKIGEARDATRDRVQRLELERDALLRDLREADRADCEHCKHYSRVARCDLCCERCAEPCICDSCIDNSKWEWRGVKADGGAAG